MQQEKNFKKGDTVICNTTTVYVTGIGEDEDLFSGVVVEQSNPALWHVGNYSDDWYRPEFKKVAQHHTGNEWVKDALEWAKETIAFADKEFVCPQPLVETWGNMVMNALNAIQEAQREIEANIPAQQSYVGREDAVAFAQWLANERWQPRINTEWARYETTYSDVSVKTTAELYDIFQQQKDIK